MRTSKIALLALALNACGEGESTTVGDSVGEAIDSVGASIDENAAYIDRAKARVTEKFADPEAARFRNLSVNEGVVCGEVNAKNMVGAFVGYTGFSYIEEGDGWRYRVQPEATLLREGIAYNADNCGSKYIYACFPNTKRSDFVCGADGEMDLPATMRRDQEIRIAKENAERLANPEPQAEETPRDLPPDDPADDPLPPPRMGDENNPY